MAATPWVVLRLRETQNEFLLQYSDSAGRALDGAFRFGSAIPEAVTHLIRDLAQRIRYGRVPVFFDPEIAASAGALNEALDPVAKSIERVYLARGPWPKRPPFRLPLDVITVGAATTWVRDAVNSRMWLADIHSGDAGLTTSGNWVRELLKRTWRRTETDLIVCTAKDLPRLGMALRASGHRPRVVVALTRMEPTAGLVRFIGREMPAGTSVLLLWCGNPAVTESEIIVELIRDFAHDLPLHAFGRHNRWTEFGPPPMLFSQPEALDELRLSHALFGITDQVLSLSATWTAAGVEKLPRTPGTERLLATLGIGAERAIDLGRRDYAVPAADFGGASFDQAVQAVESFAGESDALVPMASLQRNLALYWKAEAETRAATTDAMQDPELRAAYVGQQVRRVDVTMRHLNSKGNAGPFVRSHDRLAARSPYRIRVQIGRRSAISLISGDVPPIDLLLPAPEKGRRHVLHVALYTDDFDLRSPIMQRLELPEVGPSPPIHFDVVPRQDLQNAQARIAVYYDLPPDSGDSEMRNHLVQTFLLTAAVAASEDQPATGSGIKVTVEFSLDAHFSQLEHLQSRLISLALNDGPTAMSHKLMMKRGGDALPVNFTETQIGASLKNIRDTLDWASRNDARDGPRFPADQQEGGVDDFDQVIWRLAAAGHSLYQELFAEALLTPLKAALQAAIGNHDELIQAVHLARNCPFPWTALYDFTLPPNVTGGPVPTICKGFRRQNGDGTPLSCGECLTNCQYPDKRQAVCVYGFWGTRHQVEQLIVEQIDKPQELRPIGPGAVAFTMGLTGTYVKDIPDQLAQKLGTSVRQIPEDEDFLPSLWTISRPAILLLVGHYRADPIDGEPAGPRLTLPGERFLQPGDILDEGSLHTENWTDPRSVILLAACSGAVVELTNVSNFVNNFTGIGAGAVIGPEAIIYEGIARRFAVEMSEALVVRRRSVGAAVLEFRRGLLQNLNPLGLLFTAYGFADLAAPPPTPS